jgi:hypothetical protein
MKRNHVNYRQLEDLLVQLGFVETSRDDKVAVFQHFAADSLIFLPGQGGDREARTADVMSVETHLVGWGFLEEGDFAAFLENGALPAAKR